MVNVLAIANGMYLVQPKVNEITEIPKILEMLDISGCSITIEVMGCQRKIVYKIVDYLLAVKGNQGSLEQAFNDYYSTEIWTNFNGDSYSS